MSIIRRFVHFFRPYYKLSALLVVLLIISSVVTVVTPFFYQELVDHGIGQGRMRTVVLMLAATAGSLIAQELLSLGQSAITLRMREGVFAALRQRVYRHLMVMPQSYFSAQHKGRLLSRLTSDVNVLQNLFLDKLVLFLRNVLVGLFILAILLVIEWKLVAVALVSLPLLYGLYFLFRRKISGLSRLNQERQESLMERLQEDLSVVKALQAFSVVRARTSNTIPYMLRSEESRRKLDMQYAVASSSTIVINLIGLFVIWGMGGREVIEGRMTIGRLIAISFFLNYITNLFYSAYYTVMQLQGSIPSARRIFEVLDAEPEIAEPEHPAEPGDAPSAISLEQVTFGYAADKPLLRRVDLELRRGEIVAIIGESGQGKTTLANLLQRFGDPQEGRIALDGIDIRRLKLGTLRKIVAVIPQEDLLLNDTVRANILFHRPDVSEERFLRACEQAKVRAFAEKLENGYDTVIGERGANLSGGQRKRIAIARALLDNPFVLILDEATSMLDEATEQAILETIAAHSADKIVLMITHKHANLRFADRAVRVGDGAVEPIELPAGTP